MDLLTANKSVFVGECLKFASETAILTIPIETRTIVQVFMDGSPAKRGNHVCPKVIGRRFTRGGIERVCGRVILKKVSDDQSEELTDHLQKPHHRRSVAFHGAPKTQKKFRCQSRNNTPSSIFIIATTRLPSSACGGNPTRESAAPTRNQRPSEALAVVSINIGERLLD
ncbi:hypothetical protein [Stieleria varia]|uniref:hypothetical protein n=1 Tax=Stieleria varia TaxID=2528005 RepID=UPI0018D2378A|nr:hypothetical protein [Stieleria varia]